MPDYRCDKRFFLALLAVVDIAYHGGHRPVPSRDIVARHHMTRRHLDVLLGQLVISRILQSVRGPKGGYLLGRERRRICLLDIAHALESSHAETKATRLFCNAIDRSPIVSDILLPLRQEWEERHARMLSQLTIDDICVRARDKGIAQESLSHLDWTI